MLISIPFGYPPSMPVEFEMSVVQVGNSLRVTLPVEIVKAMGLKKGDKVGMVLENSHLRLRKLPK
jgi:antitoxin component of MazEF toxin-antitoxin module